MIFYVKSHLSYPGYMTFVSVLSEYGPGSTTVMELRLKSGEIRRLIKSDW